MKRTLRKRAGLWELSVPLRAPVRGIWRYGTFAEAWGHLWQTGYPPGLPSEVKMAARGSEPSISGVEDFADVDDAAHDASHSPEILGSGAAAVKEFALDVALPADQPGLRPSRISRAIAVGLAFGLAILLVILLWPLGHRDSPARPSVANSTVPNAAPPTPNPVEARVPPEALGAGKAHASIQANGPSWITACVDGKMVFSKLFTAGSKDNVDFTDHAVVRLGNAGPVAITVDGNPVGSLGQMGQVRVIELVRGVPNFLVARGADDCTLAKSK